MHAPVKYLEKGLSQYGTQEGEISFCAYNTGIGWRQIIEKMHMTATLTKWYEEHGRHEIFAGGRSVTLASAEHSLRLNPEAVAAAQTDLVEAGIARTAREEKLMARQKAREGDGHDVAYHARMAELYRQHILKEKPASPVMRIQGLSRLQASSETAPDKAGEKVPQPV